jgi:hypothetical protein
MKNQPKRSKRTFPVYPLLFAIFPVLALFVVNIAEVEIVVILRPLLVSLLVAAILLVILRLAFRQWEKAALYLLFILVLFFTYGQVYQLLKGIPSLGSVIGRHRYLIPIYLLIFLFGSWLIIRRIKLSAGVTKTLNIIMIILVILPLVQSGSFFVSRAASLRDVPTQSATKSGLILPANPPDIYYIILDMYTRQDALQHDYQYDNSAFLNGLIQMGFYVADCSRSNYDMTTNSLASSLNMDYLPQLNPAIRSGETNTNLVTSLLSNNKVRNLLRASGYKIVAFETGYAWDSWTDADLYLKPQYGSSLARQITPFDSLLLKTTAMTAVTDANSIFSKANLNSINAPFSEHISREEYILNKLGSLATLKGPKFVFAHILIPHYPFIFKPDGSLQTDANFYQSQNAPTSPEYFKEGYRDQVAFIDSQITRIVQSLISQSKTPPIIILQGDHGAKGDNRLEILNAYYLPGRESKLYSSITPVNTFRLVLDQYFGGIYSFLPDASYASTVGDNYNFVLTPESSPACIH